MTAAIIATWSDELVALATRPLGWLLPLGALFLLMLGAWYVLDRGLSAVPALVCRLRGQHLWGDWRPVNPSRVDRFYLSGPRRPVVLPLLRTRDCLLCDAKAQLEIHTVAAELELELDLRGHPKEYHV